MLLLVLAILDDNGYYLSRAALGSMRGDNRCKREPA
jgi:hypothetical protein